jgi:hypothetical protein
LVQHRSNRGRRIHLNRFDRLLWVWLSQIWAGWRSALLVVKPETVIAWHRRGFRLYWAWKNRQRQGRPLVSTELRDLIRKMSVANPRWGAPRIQGELMKLGLELSQSTVVKYMVRHQKPPSQTWWTFLKNHVTYMVSADFFVVPTISFRLLFVEEAFPWDSVPRYLLRDRGGIYGPVFVMPLNHWAFGKCSRPHNLLGRTLTWSA